MMRKTATVTREELGNNKEKNTSREDDDDDELQQLSRESWVFRHAVVWPHVREGFFQLYKKNKLRSKNEFSWVCR